MTENKQFTFDRDTVALNIKTPIVFKEGERLSIGEVLGKLNELAEENEMRKEYQRTLENKIRRLKDRMKTFEKNYSLKDIERLRRD